VKEQTMSIRSVSFLGTASQVPTRVRNHNALFLQWDDLGILFDPGEGTQRQMILAGLSSSQITHIAITHFHGDHSLGLAGIIQRLSLDRVDHPVEVIYPASGQVFFERLRHATAFYEVATLIPRPVDASGGAEVEVCRTGKARLLARSLEHGIDCQGYRLQEDDGRRMLPEKLEQVGIRGPAVRALMQASQLEVGGRTVRLEEVSDPRPGQSFALVMDTRLCAGAEALARGVDLLVCESTYRESEKIEAHEHFHMTSAGAARLAHSAGARRLALTHFSQRYTTLEGFREEAEAVHEDVFLADDLAVVRVPPRREVEGDSRAVTSSSAAPARRPEP
jgi:ribonuclease Z